VPQEMMETIYIASSKGRQEELFPDLIGYPKRQGEAEVYTRKMDIPTSFLVWSSLPIYLAFY